MGVQRYIEKNFIPRGGPAMEEKRPTMPVPAAGKKYYGLGRNASYAAAKRGDIPTIEIGHRKFAIVALIERRLGLLGDDEAPGPDE
jgi:hypothetical protein